MRIIFYIVIFCVLVAGCTPGKPAKDEKIGMHFDAVLEFVVEYPISWQKDRRLPFGSNNGEVLWTHPGHPGVLLKVQSSVNEKKDFGRDGAIDRVAAEYPNIELDLAEDYDLKGTMATHIEGQVRELRIQSYILNMNNRSYLITLEKPVETHDDFQDIVDEFVHSFRAIPTK